MNKLHFGLLKLVTGVLITLIGGILIIRGCGQVTEALQDESNEIVVDETGDPVEF